MAAIYNIRHNSALRSLCVFLNTRQTWKSKTLIPCNNSKQNKTEHQPKLMMNLYLKQNQLYHLTHFSVRPDQFHTCSQRHTNSSASNKVTAAHADIIMWLEWKLFTVSVSGKIKCSCFFYTRKVKLDHGKTTMKMLRTTNLMRHSPSVRWTCPGWKR